MPSAPLLRRAHVVLAVPDLDRSRAWYEMVLGCTAAEPDPGNWLFMTRDVVVFMLGRCPDALPVPELGDHAYVAYLVVDDVDALHDQAEAAMRTVGGRVRKAPVDEPWGMRECALETVDGHRLMLGRVLHGDSDAWPAPAGPPGARA